MLRGALALLFAGFPGRARDVPGALPGSPEARRSSLYLRLAAHHSRGARMLWHARNDEGGDPTVRRVPLANVSLYPNMSDAEAMRR